jgi:hypothetical protein
MVVRTPEQTHACLDFMAEDRLYATWHLITFRGLRRGEDCTCDGDHNGHHGQQGGPCAAPPTRPEKTKAPGHGE